MEARLDALALARRAAQVPPFHVMAMARAASELEAAGRHVVHLEVGQPATPAPAGARAAAAAAIDRPQTLGYTNAAGMQSLRHRIARHYRDWYGLDVDAVNVLVVAGASAGFLLAFLSCFEEGSRVGVLQPGYPPYRNTLGALGIEAVPIPVDVASRWAPTPDLLDEAQRRHGPLTGLIIASPSNPTGTVLDDHALGDLAAYCATQRIRLIADEIYHGITFTGPAPSVLAHDRQAIVVNSFSKYFSMTGWRLGWMVVPDDLVDVVERLAQNLYICAPAVSQVAGLAAFDCGEELDAHVRRYAANRDVLLSGLAAAGVDRCAEADGAFYVYADVGELIDRSGFSDSMALARTWLDQIDVAVAPGADFDTLRGGRFVRLCYAGDEADIRDACTRIRDWTGR